MQQVEGAEHHVGRYAKRRNRIFEALPLAFTEVRELEQCAQTDDKNERVKCVGIKDRGDADCGQKEPGDNAPV